MNITLHATTQAQFPMRKLEQIEQALKSIDEWADIWGMDVKIYWRSTTVAPVI